jgi:SAM-dependent methyltransferase
MNKVNYEVFWQGKWNDTTIYGPACRHRRRIIINLAKKLPHAHILDMGCGDGSLLAEISAKLETDSLAGTDISEEALSIARQNLSGIELYPADLNGQIMLHRRYDIIILSEVLEHLENDENVLRQIAPDCRYVIISVPGGAADKVDKRYGHIRNYSGPMISDKLNRNGFDTILFKRWGWPLYDLQQYLTFSDKYTGATITEGSYKQCRKIIARLVYAANFLNLPGYGILFRGTLAT